MIVAIIKRDNDILIPRGDLVLEEADLLVLGAEPYEDDEHINLKEVVLKTHNPWTGLRIRDLDISRQSVIVLVKRRNKSLIPNGNMKLEAGDRVFIYTKLHLPEIGFSLFLLFKNPKLCLPLQNPKYRLVYLFLGNPPVFYRVNDCRYLHLKIGTT